MRVTVSIRKRVSASFSLDVSFDSAMEGGERNCLGILGASGSGKSMTLKCIAGVETPDEGHISVDGRALFDSERGINLKPQARGVGYLFQNYALFPRMTVLDNIRAGLSGPAAEIRRKTRDYIERFELSGLERRFPRQLSGGEQQRTALARMLIREPCLVLLDEPFSALDTNLREQIRLRFLEIVASRRNAILVSHSRDDVYTLCGETLVIDAGASIAMDNTAALFQNPQSVRVARLTGCKNITPVTRKSEREMYARDWGLTLRTALPVTEDISHAGIRAHDFRPASGEGYNEIRPAVRLCAEEPFERTVVFTNAETDDPGGHGALWWKYSAYQRYAEIPRRLFIPPEAVLLLRS